MRKPTFKELEKRVKEFEKAGVIIAFERNKFNSFLEQLPVGVTVLDAEDKYIYINPISLKMDKYNKDVSNLIGKNVRSNHPENAIPEIENILHNFKTGEKSFYSREAKRGDDTIEIHIIQLFFRLVNIKDLFD